MGSLTDIIYEQSTVIITAAFTDEDSVAVIPNSITWSLTDSDSDIINGLEDEVVAIPAASIDIVLSGDDLEILSTEAAEEYVYRFLVVEALYDSAHGTDLKLKSQVRFTITNLKKVEA